MSVSGGLSHSALVYFLTALLITATQLHMVSSQHPHMLKEPHTDKQLDAAFSALYKIQVPGRNAKSQAATLDKHVLV